MYKCDNCGILPPNECNYIKDDHYDEIYVTCKHCGCECFEYDSDEEEEQEQ